MNKNELYHFGIKGMKWGVRRYQNKDGSLTVAGKRRYTQDQKRNDESYYGEKGVKRIEERMNKGDSHKVAVAKEFARQVGTGAAFSAAVVSAGYILGSGGDGVRTAVSAGKKAVTNFMDSKYNSAVVNASGQVLKRYDGYIDLGKALIDKVMG